MYINLLKETKAILKETGKSIEDVRWVGNHTYHYPWSHFEKIANVEYNAGYGGAEIPGDLQVVGDDWWLERGEYDGSEWWEYKTMPTKPAQEVMLSDVKDRSR
jgi:hypothetical protein